MVRYMCVPLPLSSSLTRLQVAKELGIPLGVREATAAGLVPQAALQGPAAEGRAVGDAVLEAGGQLKRAASALVRDAQRQGAAASAAGHSSIPASRRAELLGWITDSLWTLQFLPSQAAEAAAAAGGGEPPCKKKPKPPVGKH